eukprot:TRINITY_DN13088_c0_g1_i3.p1 TRINITY_DN13088_c0_g1~~TRINITY_DN13088_c0_g1_i3.p1  ORF type:complete len:327 (+),score=51.67 TRINITY_DN13088_c0_g1_i3:76-1056(+)
MGPADGAENAGFLQVPERSDGEGNSSLAREGSEGASSEEGRRKCRCSWRVAVVAACVLAVVVVLCVRFWPNDPYSCMLATALDRCETLLEAPTEARVVTYNLFWWCVSDQYGNCGQNGDGRGFQQLFDRIQMNQPFDLAGFQECDNVRQVLQNSGYCQCTEAYSHGDIALVWNNRKYGWIEDGTEVIGHDKYGDRWVSWVRLAVRSTVGPGTLLFANTHGPLWQCNGEHGKSIADNYAAVINKSKKPGDTVIFTGDFNCGSDTDTMRRLSELLTNAVTGGSFGGADHIYSSGQRKCESPGHHGKGLFADALHRAALFVFDCGNLAV